MRKRLLGICVISLIALPHLTTEAFGTRDSVRFLSKGIALLIGLPVLIVWGSAVFRWASRRGLGVLGPLLVGAVTAGIFFAGLLTATRATVLALAPQLMQGTWRGAVVLNIGFAIGLTSFALWVLAFVLPFAVENARVRALEAEKLRTQVELAQLRAHLEPHFMLNTLNAIAGLVSEDPRKACQLLGTVGDLLRDSMAPNGELETLDAQIEWLRRYAQILEARHADHLAFHWQIGGPTLRALVPRLLLQPLLENAVKHGALMRAGGGEITVRTELAEGPKLVCTIADNGPGVPNGATRPGAFGLSSVHRRLALRYSEAASLRVESSPAGTRCVVELPLEQGSDP